MQHIPDKEFDKLFKDKFTDAEIEPSANLWINIAQQLEPKRKRSFRGYWLAAASVVVAITAVLVFQKTEKITLHGTGGIAIVTKPNIGEGMIADNMDTVSIVPVTKHFANESSVASDTVKASVVKALEIDLKNIQEPVQPMIATDRLAIKQQDVKPLEITPIKEPEIENPIVIAAANTKQSIDDNTISETGTERKGIRNVGDLVNFVVDKVDKRDKKLIRFNTDDDDNSSLIGINIGFLKFNKKSK